MPAYTVVASPINPLLAYAYGANSSGAMLLYSSNSQGTDAWPNKLAANGLPGIISSMQVSPLDASIWVSGSSGSQYVVMVSTDGGNNFAQAFSITSLPINTLLLDPNNAGGAYVSYEGGITHLTNYGATAANISAPAVTPNLLFALDADGVTYYAMTISSSYSATVYRSTNGGGSWTSASVGLQYGVDQPSGANALPTFAASPTTPGLVLVGTDRAGIFDTTTGGQ